MRSTASPGRDKVIIIQWVLPLVLRLSLDLMLEVSLAVAETDVTQVITSEDRPVSRYEAGMMDKLAAKDSEIALLKSNTYTDQKLADVYDRLLTIINRNKEEQTAINMNQAVYNGTNTATLSCMKQQIAELAALSELVVPQRKVCDTGCCCNG